MKKKRARNDGMVEEMGESVFVLGEDGMGVRVGAGRVCVG